MKKMITFRSPLIISLILCSLIILNLPTLVCSEGKQSENLIELLGSLFQKERDNAAEELRKVFSCSNKEKWKQQLSWLLPEMALKDVEKKLEKMTGRKSNVIIGGCSGGSCSQDYRLDNCYVLRISYHLRTYVHLSDDKYNKVISSEVIERMEYKWVEPPTQFTGIWVTYYVNGRKSHEINYKNGKYNGDCVFFHPNGNKSYIQHYQENRIKGEEFGYFPSGKLMYKGKYKNGKQVGKWVWYKEDGTVDNEIIK